MSQRAPGFSAVLAVREFRALWFAEAQSIFGDQLAKVALTILVYDRTGSALWAALVYALTFLSALAGGLGLSQLADRFPRRQLMVTCTAAQAVLVGLMAIPGMSIPALCALVLAVGLAQSPAAAAQNAVTRVIFKDDELYLRSQDLRGITTNTLMLLGLAGGGVLVVGIGTSWALAINAVTFAISTVVVHRFTQNREAAGSSEDGWFGAARYVFGTSRMRVLITLSWLVGLVVIPEGLVAPLAKELGASSAAIGVMLAADPLGFVVGTYVLSRFVPAHHRVRVMGVLAAASSATLILFALNPHVAFAIGLLALSGAFGAYQITVSATFTSLVPDEIRGGAFGIIRTGLRVSQGVGVAVGGAVAEGIGSTTTTIALAGALGLAIAIPTSVAWARHTNPSRQTGVTPNLNTSTP
ncbi:MFS transporter [Actinophytocola gossypii]|uniref:MFS transporter n=1 Tax=Actinophytocola gossypii TaxID=2812003 RepID=A0ABT2JJ47_9PSEU|nr:MFS transporter [Actinophytocola gossypii]MCT2587909.1 MFS transporter [Actinophytocola gossypii]